MGPSLGTRISTILCRLAMALGRAVLSSSLGNTISNILMHGIMLHMMAVLSLGEEDVLHSIDEIMLPFEPRILACSS